MWEFSDASIIFCRLAIPYLAEVGAYCETA